MPYTPPAWDSVNFEGSGDAYTSPAWDEVDFNQGHVHTTAAGDSSGTSTAAAASVALRTAQTTISGAAAAASISYSVGSGHPAGLGNRLQELDRLRCRAICGRRVCFRDRHEPVRQRVLPGLVIRQWVNPARIGVGRSAGTSVAASVNPYLTSRGASSGASDAQGDQLCEGRRKVKREIVRKDAARSQAAGMDQEVVRDGLRGSRRKRRAFFWHQFVIGGDMTLPTFDGEKDKTLGRVMLAAVDGPDGIRTRISSNAFGSKTMLRTRNGMPEFTTVRAQEGTDASRRGSLPTSVVRGTGRCLIPTRWKSWTQNIVWWGVVLSPGFRHRMERIADGPTHWYDTIVLTARSSRSTRRR